MTLGEEELQKIGLYVQSHLPEWFERSNITAYKRDREIDMVERIVRVEEELKSQRELMKQGFESMDKRFSSLQWFMGMGFTMLAIILTVFKYF
jgi:glutathione S-transferase